MLRDAISKFFKVEELTEHLSGYVETRIALLKIEIREEVAKAITRVMVMGVVVLLGIFVLLFISIGTAIWLNNIFQKPFIGFYLMGAFYAFLLLISYSLRKRILKTLDKILNEQIKHLKD